jgi:hypothetical protein
MQKSLLTTLLKMVATEVTLDPQPILVMVGMPLEEMRPGKVASLTSSLVRMYTFRRQIMPEPVVR